MSKATWKNKAGVEFGINIISPFFEDELSSELKKPSVPYYKVEQFGEGGVTEEQFFPHTDNTMLEIDTEPALTPAKDRTHWLLDGQPTRWSSDVSPQERKAWKAFKESEKNYNKRLTELMLKRTLSCGLDIVIPDEFTKEQSDKKPKAVADDIFLSYVLKHVVTEEAELQELFLTIQRQRNIDPKRISLMEDAFRSQA